MIEFDKFVIPASMLGTFVGGVAWLTKLHQIALQNKKAIDELKKEHGEIKIKNQADKDEIVKRIGNLETMNGKMDGKLDILIKILESRS